MIASLHPWAFTLLLTLPPVALIAIGAMAWPRLQGWRVAWARGWNRSRRTRLHLRLWWQRREIAEITSLGDSATAVFRRLYLPILIVGAVWFLADDWWRLVTALRDSAIGAADGLATTDPSDTRAGAEAAFRNLVFNLGVAMTGLVAAATAPFALLKAWLNERSTGTTEQTHLTELFTDAVDKLGATRERKAGTDTITEPNIEVRLGAIYALERIALDSARDHIPVMETLCAYIRENTKDVPAPAFPLPPWYEEPVSQTEDGARRQAEHEARYSPFSGNLGDWVQAQPSPRADVQTAIMVLGRRPARRVIFEWRRKRAFRADLRGANLRRTDLSGLDLRRALLAEARMEGANLNGAQMEGANLNGAQMEGADLGGARMEGANLGGARMEGADLTRARMEGANLFRARMEGADLTRARMEGANLFMARMEGANLTRARMEGAYLRWARMEGADLTRARMEAADLIMARMEGADLSRARMEAADLRWARMEGADLTRASMEGANLSGAQLKSARAMDANFARSSVARADFTDVTDLTAEQMASALGDAATLSPKGIDHNPPHWATVKLEWHEAVSDWRRWLAAGCPKTANWRDTAPPFDRETM